MSLELIVVAVNQGQSLHSIGLFVEHILHSGNARFAMRWQAEASVC